jgi:hypothetical protein
MAKNNGFFPNVLHGDKWRITFSNIPTLNDVGNMRYFDNYVKSCTIPAYTMGEIISNLPEGWQIRHPLGGMKKNQDLGVLSLTFKLSEDMYNYIVFFSWIQRLRYGDVPPTHQDYFRKYTVKTLTISMLDNQKRTVAELTFTNLFMTSLGALDLAYGSTEELSFTCEFTYETVLYDLKDPMIGGVEINTPTNVIECGTSGVPINPFLDWNK